jgi:hypothetical protein
MLEISTCAKAFVAILLEQRVLLARVLLKTVPVCLKMEDCRAIIYF